MEGAVLPAAAGGAAAAAAAWLLDRRRRTYTDRPTTPAAAVFAGRNEVKGRAAAATPLTSHRTSTPSVWWEYRLEEERTHTRSVTSTNSQGKTESRTETYRQWHETDRKSDSLDIFEVVDDTGSVSVRLAGARIEPREVCEEIFEEDSRGFLARMFDNKTGRYRETEKAVAVGDLLFVVGDAQLDDATCVPILAHNVLVSTHSEESQTSLLGVAVAALVALATTAIVGAGALLVAPDEPGRPSAWLPGLAVSAVLALLAWTVITYNRLRAVAQGAERAWSLIDVQLQRRHDLVPSLAATVAAHVAHERAVFADVADGGWVTGGADPNALAAEWRAQTESLRQILAIAEQYPTIGADESFRRLQRELADSEIRIGASTTFYNDSINIVRDRSRSFPGLLVAKLFPLRERQLLDREDFEQGLVTREDQ